MEASEGRPEEVGAFFRELGPKAEEAYVTAAEKLTAQVRAKALVEGQAALLLKLLGLRFGTLSDDVRAKVQSAAPHELERWAEKMLSASTLEDVLGS